MGFGETDFKSERVLNAVKTTLASIDVLKVALYNEDGNISVPRSFATATNTKVSVGAVSTSVLAANTDRKYVILVNDGNEAIYLSLGGVAALNSGMRLNDWGGLYEINNNNLFTGAITAISASGGINMTVIEG